MREEYNKLLYNGNRFAADAVCEESEISQGQDYIQDCGHSYIQENAREYEQGQQYRIYDAIGNFIGIYAYRESYFVPVKIFYSGERDEM